MAIIIKIELPNLKELEKIASPKIVVRAVTRTFNKLGDQAKTATTRKISSYEELPDVFLSHRGMG